MFIYTPGDAQSKLGLRYDMLTFKICLRYCYTFLGQFCLAQVTPLLEDRQLFVSSDLLGVLTESDGRCGVHLITEVG